MKKIMFNDKCGLTDAVLDGSKTMTRRVAGFNEIERPCKKGRDKCLYCKHYDREIGCKWLMNYISYNVGEVVAVAQAYKDCKNNQEMRFDDVFGTIGWIDKRFVRADLMPHQIRITDIKVERLQDITDEDCLREGVFVDVTAPKCYRPFYTFVNSRTKENTPIGFDEPQSAFAALIDKVSGKGTWERNPWVFAYSFELVK